MTIPEVSLYPEEFDSDENLYLVRDGLRARLVEDYNPGDTSIMVFGDALVLSRFPQTGIITLTEQCSDIDERAVSLYYTSFDLTTGVFDGLELLPNTNDYIKSKKITNVTQNVMDVHHNNIKDSVIAIEEFIGIRGTTDDTPFGDTLEGRTNFLRNVALQPRAWFTSDKRTGIVPFSVTLKDMSFRLGTDGTSGPVIITWDFGDNTTSVVSLISTISATSEVPQDADNVYVYDIDGGEIKKTYLNPGYYDVTLTVRNDFGTDVCKFSDFINARVQAPKEAVIKFVENDGQLVTPGTPSDGPYEVNPRIRSPINTLIEIEIPSGENPSDSGYSYAGELLNGSTPIDPISNYTWSLGDELNHPNSPNTKAAYPVGGIYDLKLRADTAYGAYRITTYEDCVDIVENTNLWLYTFEDETTIRSWEYGLISQTFKLNANTPYTLTRNESFLDNVPQSAKQKKEFRRNVGTALRGTLASGKGGGSLLYWATGRDEADPVSTEEIAITEYTGFTDTYISRDSITRPWNWCTFANSNTAFFAFGKTSDTEAPDVSPTNLTRVALNLISFTTQNRTLTNTDFENNASELTQNPSLYDSNGDSTYGHFSVYRTAWKDSTGYIARNDGVGPFFRIKSFYRTEGSVGSPFQRVRKLTDIQGTTKYEGQLINLSKGIYFFNNSGSVSAFDESASVWKTGGPGVNSVTYRELQDTSVSGFDDPENSLLVASDGDHRAYLSFDYSENVFIKFDEIDTTFTTLGSRPVGEQLIMGVY